MQALYYFISCYLNVIEMVTMRDYHTLMRVRCRLNNLSRVKPAGHSLTPYLLLFSLLLNANVYALDEFTGLEFSDPSLVAKVPDGWREKPFTFEKWADGADLVVSLDQHLYPVLSGFIKDFARSKGIKIAVKEGTCGISSGILRRKAADMAGFCCPPGKDDRLPGLKYHTIGMLPVAILVNADNPIEEITLEEARRIFQGKVVKWSEVKMASNRKGTNLPIKVIGRLHCKDMPGHWRLFLDREDLFCWQMTEVGEIQMMINSIADYPGAIGYEVPWNVVRFGRKGQIKVLSIDGNSPYDQQKLVKGKYPIYELLNITTWDFPGNRAALSRELLTYIYGRLEQPWQEYNLVTAAKLKRAGWRFSGNELIGRPDGK